MVMFGDEEEVKHGEDMGGEHTLAKLYLYILT